MIPKVCAIGVIVAFTGFLLSEMGFKGKKIFVALSVVLMLIYVAGETGSVISETVSIFMGAGIGDISGRALKIVGLGYVFGISCEVCEELGETGIQKALTLVGRVEIIGVTLPYIKEILELGISLIK
jgi:hypothetical protein